MPGLAVKRLLCHAAGRGATGAAGRFAALAAVGLAEVAADAVVTRRAVAQVAAVATARTRTRCRRAGGDTACSHIARAAGRLAAFAAVGFAEVAADAVITRRAVAQFTACTTAGTGAGGGAGCAQRGAHSKTENGEDGNHSTKHQKTRHAFLLVRIERTGVGADSPWSLIQRARSRSRGVQARGGGSSGSSDRVESVSLAVTIRTSFVGSRVCGAGERIATTSGTGTVQQGHCPQSLRQGSLEVGSSAGASSPPPGQQVPFVNACGTSAAAAQQPQQESPAGPLCSAAPSPSTGTGATISAIASSRCTAEDKTLCMASF